MGFEEVKAFDSGYDTTLCKPLLRFFKGIMRCGYMEF